MSSRKDVLGQNADIRFVGIPIRSFIGGRTAVADLFVKLGDNHYTRVVGKNTDFDLEQFTRYQNLEVKLLYVRKEDFIKFAQQSLKVANVVSKSLLTQKQKISVITRAVENVYIEFSAMGVSPDAVRRSSDINKLVYKLILENPQLTDIVFELSQCSMELVKHCMATSMFVGLIIQALGWKEKTVVLASLGGLLHDVGLLNMPADLLWRERVNMTPEEMAMYDEHQFRGANMLSKLPGVAEEVVAIVLEHHDLPSAPADLNAHRALEMYPLSRAVAFADCLADLVIKTEGNLHPKDFKSAVDLLENTQRTDFPGLYFDAARKVIKMQAAS